MLYRRAPVASQLESLRYLTCADISTISLANTAYASLVESNQCTLTKRAISVRYWQGYPGELNGTAPGEHPDAETLEEYEAYEAVVEAEGGYAVVGSLKIEERSGTNKRIFRAFPVAIYEKGKEHPVYLPIPEQVDQLLRRVLSDRVLGVVECLDVNNYTTANFSKKIFSLLRTAIEVPVRELHARIEHEVDPADIERLVGELHSKSGILYAQLWTHQPDYVFVCTGFGCKTTLDLEEWYEGASTILVQQLFTTPYNPQCQLLVRLGECEDDTHNVSVAYIRTLTRFLYTLFMDRDLSWISLPQQGVWLYFSTIDRDSLPDSYDFLINSLGGTESPLTKEHVTLPVPKGVYDGDGEEKKCKCTAYSVTSAHREQTLRVCVGWTDDEGRLLMQLALR